MKQEQRKAGRAVCTNKTKTATQLPTPIAHPMACPTKRSLHKAGLLLSMKKAKPHGLPTASPLFR